MFQQHRTSNEQRLSPRSLQFSDRKHSESQTDEFSDMCCNNSDQISDEEIVTLPNDDLLKLPWSDRVHQYRKIANILKKSKATDYSIY